ncbi:uncharacterized protein TNCT_247991 [Trichonephila clavata]|uniref:Uncharacterized protein n=1 Tax=Trichonephila clavata TaxID=2740835 RepID=A0A8X6LA59_TRICU|nr:uncharacterized protein TNCT_247991 [Trichonephila clavata]
MADSNDDKSPQRRDKVPEKPSEDSKSSNKPVEVDPSDMPPDSTTKAEEKDASENKPIDRLSVAPPGSYGGARPKVYPQKKEDERKKSSNITVESNLQRATEVLEATVSRRRELFRRRREEAKKAEEPVSRYLGPDWIDAAANERAPSVSPATQRLRTFAQNISNSEYERRRRERREDFKPWISSTESGPSGAPTKQTLSDKPCEGKFEDDFKSESDSDDPPRLQVKLPDLAKKSPKPPQKPKDKGKPVEDPSHRVVEHDRYHVESISRYMFLDRPPFVRPEFDPDVAAIIAYHWLDAIYAQHGIQDWRRFTLAAYQAGRYHTEQQLQAAREQMEELQVTEEEYLKMYHIVRRDYDLDEGCCDEFSELVERIMALLELLELLTSAMLYMDIWQNRTRREETEQRGRVRRLLKATMDDEAAAEYLPPSEADEQRKDPPPSSESSTDRSDSAILEDYPSKSEEKTPPFFYETLREYVSVEMDYRPRHLTLETRPPSVLSSSDKSSTPPPLSPVEIASPSPEGIASPDNASLNSAEAEMDDKMKFCALVPLQQVPVECSNLSLSRKSLKLSHDTLTDTSPLSPLKDPRVAQLQEIDSSDNTSENVSPLPVDSPDVPELEEDSFEVNAERFQIVPHVIAMSIVEGVMNATWDELAALSLGNKDIKSVADQKSESSETQSTDSIGKRKVHQTDSDEESGKKMSKKRHVE